MKPILFFDPSIKIAVHTATHEYYVGKSITLAEFAQYKHMSLYELENGELLARTKDHGFIEGKWL